MCRKPPNLINKINSRKTSNLKLQLVVHIILLHSNYVISLTVILLSSNNENNRTQCSHCQQTNHLYFRCPNAQKNCFNCRDPDHIAEECPHDVQCNYCGENEHIKKYCILYRRNKAHGDYWWSQ